ncbi:hypothetical protein GCM10027565_05340 [Bordetella tumulicola]
MYAAVWGRVPARDWGKSSGPADAERDEIISNDGDTAIKSGKILAQLMRKNT